MSDYAPFPEKELAELATYHEQIAQTRVYRRRRGKKWIGHCFFLLLLILPHYAAASV